MRVLEREVCKKKTHAKKFNPSDLRAIYEKNGFAKWRGELFDLLISLPQTSSATLGDWATRANDVLKATTEYSDVSIEVKRNSQKCRYRELPFSKVFGRLGLPIGMEEPRVQTVHAVKGETLDAVMLVLKKKAARGPYYRNLVKEAISEYEELRIVYVGITRARRVLALAVPSEDGDVWKDRLKLNEGLPLQQ